MFSNLLYASNSILAEGLHWDQKRQLLWFVDIDAKALISLDIDNLLSRTIKMPEKIGWVITQRNTNDLIIGLKTGIASINPDINMTTIATFPDGREEEVAVEITAQFFWPTS